MSTTSGNISIGGTLGVTGNVAVNTNKLTIAAASGNVVSAGTVQGTILIGTTGVQLKTAVTNTANPPTQAELVTAFGAANQGVGLAGMLDDNNSHANTYLVYSDGASWWYVAGTKGA